MPPIQLNRRRFLGCSAMASLALTQAQGADGALRSGPVRVGLIGAGTRGTSLLRSLLELDTQVVAVADIEPKHRLRAQGIVEKARSARPDAFEKYGHILERRDIDAVIVALPCDLHATVYRDAIRAGKHLYGEKPIALTVADCQMVEAEAARRPDLRVHIGYQRRSNPRYREGVELLHRGELGALVSASASWISSNGPMNGHDDWLSRRSRSGDWMVEQAVHVWDVFHWIKGTPPVRAFGQGRRDVFRGVQPDRDVTDDYVAHLQWADGFHLVFQQSWIAPADDGFTGVTQKVVGLDGGLDFGTGALTFRDKLRGRRTLHPGNQPDTRLALQAFLDAARTEGTAPPPVPLSDAARATAIGLLVRKAVDESRVVGWDEIVSG